MTLYFAYGSNLDAEDWQRFCARRGIAGARLDPVSPALLLDHELAFDRYAPGRRGGVLNLRARLGQAVAGALFRANGPALAALDAKEGAPFAYRRVRRHVVLPDGRAIEAMTYAARPQRPFAPHRDDLAVVRRGLAAFGIGHAMLDAAARHRPAPPTIGHLFVYGTLMDGEPNAHHLEGLPRQAAEVAGVLHDCGPYPALALGPGIVRGELVALPLDRLPAMDALEDALPAGAPGGLYRRSVLPARTAQGVLPAYLYVMDDAARFPVLPGGDWRAKPDRGAAWRAYAARTPAAER